MALRLIYAAEKAAQASEGKAAAPSNRFRLGNLWKSAPLKTRRYGLPYDGARLIVLLNPVHRIFQVNQHEMKNLSRCLDHSAKDPFPALSNFIAFGSQRKDPFPALSNLMPHG